MAACADVVRVVAVTDLEAQRAEIIRLLDAYERSDPYHAGRVAYMLRVDLAFSTLSRIREVVGLGDE